MKRLLSLIIISVICIRSILGQEFDLTFTGSESGTQSHVARNSVTLGPGYTYMPSGGSLTVEIQNPIVLGAVSYTSTPVDPETRTLNTSYLVGATNGSFNVNPMGGASYNIPLEMLPGVNGLSPSMSLTYLSNSGPGLAGYGWQIGGLSTITRGPQTYYHDGTAIGIELATTDRFYLDGQRLVPTSGNYGDAGTLYQTDNDIFTRVSPQATDSYGPGWFKAETKTGLVFEYGNTNASKQKINGYSQVVNWYVSKVSDLFGNQMNFAYIQDNYSVLPAEITYGPNTVTFYYKQRTDKISSYLKGAKIEQWLLLDKITIKYNSNVVKTYEFKYTSQGPFYNFYSNLNEIIEYGIGTSRLNSTAITYQIPANVDFQQTMYNTSHPYVTYNYNLIEGDYNGDGKSDFLIVPKTGTWSVNRVYFVDGNDNFSSTISESFSLDVSTLLDIRSLDINGDGRDDILIQTGTPSASSYKYMLYDGTPFTGLVNITSGIKTSTTVGLSGKSRRSSSEKQGDDNEKRFTTGNTRRISQINSENKTWSDYNGDGVNDIFYNDTDGNWIIKSFVNSSGIMLPYLITIGSGTISTLTSEVLSGDFNGDGKADLWSFEDTGVKIYTFNGTGLSILYNSTWPSKKHFFTLGDFNADGKVDVFLYGYGRNSPPEYDWSEWQIQLSTGTGFEGYSFPKKKNNLKDDYVRLGDFNGDGATDIMVTSQDMSWNGSYFYISKNNGTDFYSHNLPYYPIASHNYYVADYNGDGHTDFICTDGVSPWWSGYQVYRTSGNTSILMEKVGNGLGIITKPSYIKLSQASSAVYQRGNSAVYPLSDFQGPWTVVSSMLVDNGKGTFNTMNYYYEGAKIHLQGKGFLGYLKSRISDVAASIESENVITNGFNSDYFYPNVQLTISKRLGTNDTIDKSKSTFTQILLNGITKRIFVYPQVAVQTNKLTGHKITVTSSYDNYGNPTSIVKTYLNGPTETTTNVYNDEKISSSQWLLGRPTSTTLQYTGGGNTITRSGSRVFATNSNNLNSETWHSETDWQIIKGFKYNTNGTLKRDSIKANGSHRTTVYTYESNSIRIKTIRDPSSHTDSLTYDSYGRLQKKKDYLSNTITYTYDDMGREATISSTVGNQTSTTFAWESPASNPKPARYSVLKTGNDGSQAKSWFDKLGREVRSDAKGFDGTWIYTSKRYNLKGQIDSISDPYFSNGSPLWNRYKYDNYGRIDSLTRPSGRKSKWTYNNNVVTETTGGKSFTKTYSSDGTLSSAQDAGGTINYAYYPDGKIKTITTPGNIITQMEYDIAGNQTKLIDPSAGTINYTYNGYGELVTQQNAKSQTTTIIYNTDGTIKRKKTPDGTVRYRYNANKQLLNINFNDTISLTQTSHTYSYDSKGRVISVIDTIPGTTPLTTSFTFDSYGRMSSITHPSGITETYNYNGNGYLCSLSAGESTRWTTTAMNARGQVTAGQYGSDLSATYGFDAYGYPTSTVTGSLQSYSYNFNTVTGNLDWRQNNKYSNLKETFNYDNLERLDNVYKGTGTPVLTLDMAYESNKGGISTKSDAGTMIYNYPGKPYALGGINPVTDPEEKTLGNTDVYSLSSTTANRRAQTITFPEAGTIQSISMYHNGGTGKVLFGVYADANGAPGGRLGVTSSTVINSTAGWQTVSLISPVAVISGQKVWLSWVFENNPGVRYVAGTPARAQSADTWPGGMPDPFGTSAFANYKYSVYCTYTTGTGVVPGLPQSMSYTSFESISTISENNYVASFTYNPEAQRAKMVVQQSGNTILTRWYSGSSYVKETAGGVTKQYTFIGGDAYTAPVVAIKTGTGTPVYYYLLRDYLGSVTHVVNTSKTLVAEYSYDAWGRMRNPSTWDNFTPGSEPALFVAGRGFTGHEHLPWFNSINMNGRVYDPLIGQFLSPDNYVQAPDFTQNFNRYSYCLNNPLKYTDPDGEWIFTILAGIFCPALLPVAIAADIGGIMNVATHIENINNFGQLAGFYGIGAASGAAGAAVGLGVSSAFAGGTFLGGILGTSTKVATGFSSGLVSGTAGGFTGGFINGFGNTAMDPQSDFGDMLSAGWNSGVTGAIFGGVAGGITGGIDAVAHERTFFTGELKPRQDVLVRVSDGNIAFNAEEIIPKENFKYFDTPLSNNSNVTAINNTDQLSIKYPRGVRITGVRQYGDNFIPKENIQFGKHALTITPIDKTGSVLLYGYRYYKNTPLSSFRDLFHFRPR